MGLRRGWGCCCRWFGRRRCGSLRRRRRRGLALHGRRRRLHALLHRRRNRLGCLLHRCRWWHGFGGLLNGARRRRCGRLNLCRSLTLNRRRSMRLRRGLHALLGLLGRTGLLRGRRLRRALLLLGRFTPGVFVVGLAPGGLRQFDSRLRGSVIGGERQRCQQECRQSGAGEKAAGRKTHACRVCHGCPCVKFLCAMKMPLDAPG